MDALVFGQFNHRFFAISRSAFEFALGALLVLNALDGVLTSWWVAVGTATEANPIMAHLLDQGIPLFLLAKVAVGIGAVAIFKRHRRHALARAGVVVLLVLHTGVFALHMAAGIDSLWSGPTLIASR